MNNDPRSLTRRPSRSPAASVLALCLIVIGVLGVWLTLTLLVTGQWPSQAAATMESIGSRALGSPAVMVVAVVLAVIGLGALLLALWPGRPRHLAVLDDDVPGQTAVSQRDMATLVQRRVEQVDGVESVRVRTSRRRADVRVTTVLHDDDLVRDSARSAAERTIDQIRPAQPMRARVRVRRAG